MCLGARTSPYLVALSLTRFWRGWVIWRVILHLLVTNVPGNLSYAKPQLEMTLDRKYPLMVARSGMMES
jgi:hypothetical protein